MALKVAEAKAAAAAPIVSGIQADALNFRYAMTGDKPAWRPEHVFDDGNKVYIQFPRTIDQSEMPPLFAVGRDGKAELLNYRVQGDMLIVDRLFDAAELRLGTKHQAIVRIRRLNSLSGGGHD
jgi:type IV secretion system protein VirB9